MLFLILMLVLAGCRERDVNREPQATGLKLQAISLKPQAASLKPQVRSFILDSSATYLQDTFEYYMPGFIEDNIRKLKPFRKGQVLPDHANSNPSARFQNDYSQQVILKAGQTSEDVYFTATWDNDLFVNTDIYYTNGAGFELYHPLISASQFTRILPGLNYGLN